MAGVVVKKKIADVKPIEDNKFLFSISLGQWNLSQEVYDNDLQKLIDSINEVRGISQIMDLLGCDERQAAEPPAEIQYGYCIRCHERIPLNKDEPLCSACKKIWSQYENPKYRETYCHLCGKQADGIDYANPLHDNCRGKYRILKKQKS